MTEAALSTDPDAALGKLTVEDVSTPPSSSFPFVFTDVLIAWFPFQDVDII